LLDGAARIEQLEDGRLVDREVAPRLAVNLAVRTAYAEDCQGALDRWNKLIADLGVELRLPSPRFHRAVGTYAGASFDPDGNPIDVAQFARRRDSSPAGSARRRAASTGGRSSSSTSASTRPSVDPLLRVLGERLRQLRE